MTRDRQTFTVSLVATELQARRAISVTSEKLRETNIPGHRLDEIEIALAESINNVVKHAYAGRKPGLVRILCKLQSDQLDIRICDFGGPMPQNRLPQGLALDVSGPKRDLPEDGFGWFLIRELANEIWYDRRGDENHLLLRFGLADR